MFDLPPDFQLKRPDVVLYHADCPDGFGAAWVLQRFFPADRGTRYEPFAYGAPLPSDLDGRQVLLIDVSLPPDEFVELSSRADVFLIDHHASAANVLGDLSNTYFDLSRSGAGLAWDIASGSAPRPELVNLLEDRDLHRFEIEDTWLLAALDSEPMGFSEWDGFAWSLAHDRDRLVAEANAISRFEKRQARRLAEHAVQVSFQDVCGWAVNAPAPMANAVAEVLFERPDCDFVLSWFYDGKLNKNSCSWRTQEGSPVAAEALAVRYGGGGHPHAAGSRLSSRDLNRLLSGEQQGTLAAHRASAPV